MAAMTLQASIPPPSYDRYDKVHTYDRYDQVYTYARYDQVHTYARYDQVHTQWWQQTHPQPLVLQAVTDITVLRHGRREPEPAPPLHRSGESLCSPQRACLPPS